VSKRDASARLPRRSDVSRECNVSDCLDSSSCSTGASLRPVDSPEKIVPLKTTVNGKHSRRRRKQPNKAGAYRRHGDVLSVQLVKDRNGIGLKSLPKVPMTKDYFHLAPRSYQGQSRAAEIENGADLSHQANTSR